MKRPAGTSKAPAMAGGRRNSGSLAPSAPVSASNLLVRRSRVRCHKGSVAKPVRRPTPIPRNVSPISQRLKLWFVRKTKGKAPKNRYSIPSNNAENMQRFRHMGSKIKSWNGRRSEWPIAPKTDLSIFSLGTLYLSSPVSFRSFIALFFRTIGSGDSCQLGISAHPLTHVAYGMSRGLRRLLP